MVPVCRQWLPHFNQDMRKHAYTHARPYPPTHTHYHARAHAFTPSSSPTVRPGAWGLVCTETSTHAHASTRARTPTPHHPCLQCGLEEGVCTETGVLTSDPSCPVRLRCLEPDAGKRVRHSKACSRPECLVLWGLRGCGGCCWRSSCSRLMSCCSSCGGMVLLQLRCRALISLPHKGASPCAPARP